MSSPPNDVTSAQDTPEAPDAQGPDTRPAVDGAPAPAGGPRGPLVADPLATLKFKPEIVNVLSTIFDPEIPVNIYELGLVYDIVVDADQSAEIRMTLTAPGCPAAQSLPVQVQQRVAEIPGIKEARVEIVWEPPWTKDRMSEAARLQLGIF